jgi:hypothetical protein
MAHRRTCLAAWLLLLLLIGQGCTTTVIPPRRETLRCEAGTDVYLADYGRHSGLLFPAREGMLVEFAFGNFAWFAMNQNDWHNAFGSLFFSAGSALGRRELRITTDNGRDPADVKRATGAAKITRIHVSADRAAELRDGLNLAYAQQASTEVFNPASEMYFVRVREPYSVFHNCNHVTARWLRRLGCDVDGLAATSKFVVRKERASQRNAQDARHAMSPPD